MTQSYKASKTEQSQTHLSQKRLPDPTDCVLCANWASTKHTAHNCFMKAPDNIIICMLASGHCGCTFSAIHATRSLISLAISSHNIEDRFSYHSFDPLTSHAFFQASSITVRATCCLQIYLDLKNDVPAVVDDPRRQREHESVLTVVVSVSNKHSQPAGRHVLCHVRC